MCYRGSSPQWIDDLVYWLLLMANVSLSTYTALRNQIFVQVNPSYCCGKLINPSWRFMHSRSTTDISSKFNNHDFLCDPTFTC